MVPARAAGVAFSADPVSGRSHVIIEAVPRLADELLQGRAEPSRFSVDPRGRVLLEERVSLPEAALPEATVLALAQLVRDLAVAMGNPQDVEWVWDGQALHLVQARPISTLVGQKVYSRKLVGDMSPGPIKHLVWSTNTLGMVEGVFGEIFSRLIGRNNHDFKKILKRVRSRAYVDTSFVGDLLAEVGLPKNLFDAMAREERVSRRFRVNARLLRNTPRIALFLWGQSRLDGELSDTLRTHAEALRGFQKQAWEGLEAAELLGRVEDLLRRHRHLQRCIMFASMNMAIRIRLLKRFVGRHVPDMEASDLLLGLRGLMSLEPNRELQALAAGAEELTPEMASCLLSGEDAVIRSELGCTPAGRAFLAKVDDFLGRYGYLSGNGTNFGEPAWVEEPAPLWVALGRMIRSKTPEPPDPRPRREEARRAVHQRLGPFRRTRFERRLRSAERYLGFRESLSLLMTQDTYELRRLFLALGERLHRSERIGHPEDVFFLHYEELRAEVLAQNPDSELRSLIDARKREIAADREVDPPETILGEAIPDRIPEPENARVLTGIGASAGRLRGRARVVRELAQAPPDLSAGDILVVPFSDVGWTPLFTGVGGIVAECGGLLSHTSIVAREYGLPAVVGVRGAMQHIREGQIVTLDGGSGQIYLSGDPPA